jgi:glyoxylase-like metal-dependent hydrolase (beta-lactamase superfamily II)
MNSGPSWSEPCTELVAPDVYRIPLPLPESNALRAVNVYAIVGPDGLVLIDAGWAHEPAFEGLLSALAQIGAGAGDIHRVLVTHLHRDHYSQAVTLRRRFGTAVALGSGERTSFDLVHSPGARLNGRHIAGLRAAGAAELADRVTEQFGVHGYDLSGWDYPDHWLAAGPVTLPGERELTAIETPGHTRGHLVFHDLAARLLFAGDHVLPHITPSIAFEPEPESLPLRAFLNSLQLVRSRPDAMLLPAHGPVTPSTHARIDELLAHHDYRLAEAVEALSGTVTTAFDVAQVLRWTRHGRSLDELDLANSMLAVLETTAHLELLVAQGRIERQLADGVVCYARAGETAAWPDAIGPLRANRARPGPEPSGRR